VSQHHPSLPLLLRQRIEQQALAQRGPGWLVESIEPLSSSDHTGNASAVRGWSVVLVKYYNDLDALPPDIQPDDPLLRRQYTEWFRQQKMPFFWLWQRVLVIWHGRRLRWYVRSPRHPHATLILPEQFPQD
jgi:hypothetical protein